MAPEKIIKTTMLQGEAEMIKGHTRNFQRDGGSSTQFPRVAEDSMIVRNVEQSQEVLRNTRRHNTSRNHGLISF